MGLLVAAVVVVCLTASASSTLTKEEKGAGLMPGLPARLLPAPPPLAGFERCERRAENSRCPARDLFTDQDVRRSVVGNLIWVGHAFYGIEARENISTIVAATFHLLSEMVNDRAPELSDFVDKLQLSATEKEAVIASLQLVVDYRVRSIGRKVAAAMLNSLPNGVSPSLHALSLSEREKAIAGVEKLDLTEIRKTIQSAVPPPLRKLWGEGRPAVLPTLALSVWELALDPTVASGIKLEAPRPLTQTRGSDTSDLVRNLATMSLTEVHKALFAASVLQGRVFLHTMQMCMRLSVGSLAPLNSSTYDVSDLATLDVECPLEGAPLDDPVVGNPKQAVLCSMKFGVQGADALRAVFIRDQMEASASTVI